MVMNFVGLDRIAVTSTGGIDSFVLADWVLRNLQFQDGSGRDKLKIDFLHCLYGQATSKANTNCALNQLHYLESKYGGLFTGELIDIRFTFPEWEFNSGIFHHGFQPPKDIDRSFSAQAKEHDFALIDGRNTMIQMNLFSYCSHHNIPLLLTGYKLDHDQWANLDSYRMRCSDASPMWLDLMNLVQERGFRNRVRCEAPFSALRYSKEDVIKLGDAYELPWNLTYSCHYWPKCHRCNNCVKLAKLGIKQYGEE